jgi:hypothetical protein
MKVMIDTTDFYDDIGFMAALFYNDKLNDANIYEVANRLHTKTSDDVLAQIIANGADGNNKGLFYTYLDALGIKFLDPKRALVAKMFYYILHGRININKGIHFVNLLSNYEDITKYAGDDIGIEKILGNFYAIDDVILRTITKGAARIPASDKELIHSIYAIGRAIPKGDARMTAADEERIETLKRLTLEEMEQYVHDNLVDFPMGNTTSKDKIDL